MVNMSSRPAPKLTLLAAAATALISAAVCVAALLVPAPPAVVPLVVLIVIGCPLFAAWEAPAALACLRADSATGKALAAMRRTLAELPETEHPLGL
jgi:hypothetical protein